MAEQKYQEVVEKKTQPLGVIKHVSSGKYIHPSGGKANPGNGTQLVIHSSSNDWQKRLQFQYTTEGYIKHVSSGKYIHPSGGSTKNPANDTHLVLHQAIHDAMKWDVLPDGRIKQRSSGKWWHPLGGKSKPADETPICVNSSLEEWEDRLKFIFTYPDGEGELVDIQFGERRIVGQPQTVCVGNAFATNNTNVEQVKKVTITKSYTKESSWNHTAGLEISSKITCGVDIGVKIGSELSITDKTEFSFGKTESESITISVEDSVTCSPHTKYKSTLWCKKAKVLIPYKGKIKFSYGVQPTEGVIVTDNYFETNFVTEEI